LFRVFVLFFPRATVGEDWGQKKKPKNWGGLGGNRAFCFCTFFLLCVWAHFHGRGRGKKIRQKGGRQGGWDWNGTPVSSEICWGRAVAMLKGRFQFDLSVFRCRAGLEKAAALCFRWIWGRGHFRPQNLFLPGGVSSETRWTSGPSENRFFSAPFRGPGDHRHGPRKLGGRPAKSPLPPAAWWGGGGPGQGLEQIGLRDFSFQRGRGGVPAHVFPSRKKNKKKKKSNPRKYCRGPMKTPGPIGVSGGQFSRATETGGRIWQRFLRGGRKKMNQLFCPLGRFSGD